MSDSGRAALVTGSRGPIAGSQSARQVVRTRRANQGLAPLAALPSVAALSGPQEPPKPPRGLRAPGKAVWRLVWLEAAGWLADADRPIVERLARLVDELAIYRAALVKHGAVIEEMVVSPRGDVVGSKRVANPAVKMLHDAGVELNTLASAIGLSPASRARLGLKAPKGRRSTGSAPKGGDDAS